jgi:putative PIN family toxin of toxin-antitoxin system
MPTKKSRIVIDTNIWISFLLTKDFSLFDKIITNTGLILLFSTKLLEEFIEVAGRSKFKKFFSSDDLEALLFQMKKHGELIAVESKTNICRDPKDNFLLSLSKDGKATYLITGDKDLLDLKRFGKTQIIAMKKYLSEN